MKRRGRVLLWGGLNVAVMVMIFWFSAQPAVDSDQTSGKLIRLLLAFFRPDFSRMNEAEQAELILAWQLPIRKLAHFSEYFLLGLFSRMLLEEFELRYKFWIGWGFGTLYAVTDELHQLAVEMRAPSPVDVGIDSAGVLCGILVAMFFLWFFSRKARQPD